MRPKGSPYGPGHSANDEVFCGTYTEITVSLAHLHGVLLIYRALKATTWDHFQGAIQYINNSCFPMAYVCQLTNLPAAYMYMHVQQMYEFSGFVSYSRLTPEKA